MNGTFSNICNHCEYLKIKFELCYTRYARYAHLNVLKGDKNKQNNIVIIIQVKSRWQIIGVGKAFSGIDLLTFFVAIMMLIRVCRASGAIADTINAGSHAVQEIDRPLRKALCCLLLNGYRINIVAKV